MLCVSLVMCFSLRGWPLFDSGQIMMRKPFSVAIRERRILLADRRSSRTGCFLFFGSSGRYSRICIQYS